MRRYLCVVFLVLWCSYLFSQVSENPVPSFIRFATLIPNSSGMTIEKQVHFSIYAQEKDGEPLWQEDQTVSVPSGGRISVLLGANGLAVPLSIFSTGEARWISVVVDGLELQPRSLIVSVPYALKAADAQTLGGKPLSAFVVRDEAIDSSSVAIGDSRRVMTTSITANASATSSASGYVPMWLDNVGGLGNSHLYDSGSSVSVPALSRFGVGTASPMANLDLQASDNANTFLGRRSGGNVVHNMFIDSAGFGGMQVRDGQNNTKVQLYPGGSSFFLGHNVGIGTAGPSVPLEVQGVLAITGGGRLGVGTTSPSASIDLQAGDNANTFLGRRSGGKVVHNMFIDGAGFGGLQIRDNNDGTRVQLYPGGFSYFLGHNLGIGTSTPTAPLEVAGDLRLSKSGSLIFADGTVQRSAGTGVSSVTTGNGLLGSISNGVLSLDLRNDCADGQVLQFRGTWNCATISSSTPSSQTASISDPAGIAISATNSATTGSAVALQGETGSNAGNAILGRASNADSTSTAKAIYGLASGGRATGVYGEAQSTTGANFGVVGLSRSSGGTGVFGQAISTSTAGLNSTKGVYGLVAGENGSAGVYGEATKTDTQSVQFGVVGIAHGTRAVGVQGESDSFSTTSEPVGVQGVARSATGYAAKFIKYSTSGNVIAAYSAASSASIPTLIMRVDGSGNLRTAGTVSGNGADFAEMISITRSQTRLEPGDVVVISEENDRTVELSSEPYSTRVVGVYSTKPGIVGRPDALADLSGNEIPVAMIGLVPCKASAVNGSIHRGDLLVTSSIPGHVMKATDRTRFAGAVVGKAMQSLESGTGVIEIAVTLQ